MQNDKQQANRQADPNLDIPAEANKEKHINFLAVEEESATKNGFNIDEFAAARKREWQQGIQEGKQARDASDWYHSE